MANALIPGILDSIVPISRFNKGEASRIFEEVQKQGIKVVVKNNQPVCILVSPDRKDLFAQMTSQTSVTDEEKIERVVEEVRSITGVLKGDYDDKKERDKRYEKA